jgi:hypothetical protein
MTHGYRLRFFLLLTIALVILLLPPGTGRGVQASNDDCLDCVNSCTDQRQICVENGNPSQVCFAAWRACMNYCQENFCPLQ